MRHGDRLLYGPHLIPDYVVPVSFSEAAELEFLDRLNKAGLDINKSDPEILERSCEGIDLTFGEGWNLDPLEFINMLKEGCVADRVYLPGEWDHLDLIEAAGTYMRDYPFSRWDSLIDEEIDWWIEILKHQ